MNSTQLSYSISVLIQIFQSYEEWGLPQPQVIEGENFVKCVLPRSYQQGSPRLEGSDILSLFLISDEIIIHDVMRKFAVSRATAQRWLQTLTIEKKIERLGKTRNIRYRRM